MHNKAPLYALLTTLACAWPAHAGSDTRATPLAVGDQAPTLVVTSLGGDTVDLAEVFAEGRTVLVMLRGFPGYQCPVCSRQVADFVGSVADFKKAGVRVVFVYPGGVEDLSDKASEFLENNRAVGHTSLPKPFTMIVDSGYVLTNAYGLRWDESRETALPSTFIIEQGGEVSFAKVVKEHRGRTKASDVLTTLNEGS